MLPPLIRGSLVRKYALTMGCVVVGSLLVAGLIELYFSYQEKRSALIELQHEKALAAANQIGQYVRDVEQRIALTAQPRKGVDILENRRNELKFLSEFAAITELKLIDSNGMERFRSSRLEQVSLDEKKNYSDLEVFTSVRSGKPYISPVYFLRDAEPYMTISMAIGPRDAGITVAEVNLEFLLEGISQIKVGQAGHAYVVDSKGRLIAHPDLSLVLKKANFLQLPQVKAALSHADAKNQDFREGRDIDGRPVLASYGAVPLLGWFVIVEQPVSEAYAPLYLSIFRTGLILVGGVLLSLIASIFFARRMVAPIQELQKGAAQIGTGSLEQRVEVKTGDELEALADQFNRMASRLRDSYMNLESKVEQRTEELAQRNVELDRTLQALNASQAHLIQSEKMASLGQLVASVAHEINTPIAAIKSSGGIIAETMGDALINLPKLMQVLEPATQSLLLRLIQQASLPVSTLSTREERALKRTTTEKLETLKVEDAAETAGLLVQLQAHTEPDTYLPLLQHPQRAFILETAATVNTIVKSAHNINTAVERVSKIVFALKSYSRSDASGEMRHADVGEGIDTVLTIYQNQIKRGTELVRDFEPMPPILCLPDELNQVWTNLIHNALQAMTNPGTLTVMVRQRGTYVVVSIADTGSGIPEAIRSRIFDPFFTTKPTGEGSGLGLDIVKKIVEKHYGRIEVQSEVNIGTTFSVYLPIST
jgi:two-component system NtrC family sensor kinase